MVSSVLFKILKLSIHAGANPIKLFFSSFSFFGVKLGLFTINYFFLYPFYPFYPLFEISGLEEVSKLTWINKSRVFLHIADAPCHGKRFHLGVNDDHLNGDPKGLQIKDLLTDISNRKILYFFTEINTVTQKMIEEFNKNLSETNHI